MNRSVLTALAASLAIAMAGSTARAADLLDFAGPTAQLPSPDFISFVFNADEGEGRAAFTIDGFRTLDGIVANNLEDDFILTLNGEDILRGTWDLGGGGQSQVFFGFVGTTVSTHSNGIGLGGVLQISTPLFLNQGQNTIIFSFASAKPEGLDNEGWDLRDLRITSVSATPEPAAWALMLMGLLGAGAGLRRARRPALA